MAKQKIPASKNKTTPITEKTTILPAWTEGNFHTESFFKKYWLESLILFAFAIGLYFQTYKYGYVLDDLIVIQENKFTKEGISGIDDILTTESMTGYFGEQKNLVQGNRYRPLSLVTFALEYEWTGGMNPDISHIINAILYGLTGLMLMMYLHLLFRNFSPVYRLLSIPFVGALLYTLHPIHVEAVANIKGRDEIMAMLFALFSAYASLRFMDQKSREWLIASALGLFLGLLSKENAITFLAVIPLSIYFFSKKSVGQMTSLITVLGVTTLAYLMLRFNTAGVPKFGEEIKDIMNNPFLGMTGIEKFGTIFYTLGKYILLLIFPHPLTHDYYPYAIPKVSLFNPYALISFLTYAAILWYALKHLSRRSIPAFAALFYLSALSIVSNLLINLGTFMNDRFIFMASAGFSVLTAWFISEKMAKGKYPYAPFTAIALALVLTLGYAWKTLDRVPDWENALALNTSAIKVSHNSARANSFMSTALFEEYKSTEKLEDKIRLLNEALPYAQKAATILPDYFNANLMEAGIVAELYKMDGDVPKYIKNIKPVMLRRPDIPFLKEFSDYLNGQGVYTAELYRLYLDVGVSLLSSKKYSKWALQYLLMAQKLSPAGAELNAALSNAYTLMGDSANAQRYLMLAKGSQ